MKYMGSKNRIASDIVPIIQKYIFDNEANLYIEPFVGGANIIDKICCTCKVGADINEYLIHLLKYVQSGGILPKVVTAEEYNYVKNNAGKFPKWYVGCVGFLGSYNGKFFGGYAKKTYTKTGIIRDYYDEARRNIIKQAKSFQNIIFEHSDYKDTYSLSNNKKAVIYCDPPYADTTKYKTSTPFNNEEFWETMRVWSKNNIVLISEQKAPIDFQCIWKKTVIRTNNNANRTIAVEKLYKLKNNLSK